MQWVGAVRGPARRSRILDIGLAVAAAVPDGLLMWSADYRDFWLPPAVCTVAAVLLALTLVVRRRHPVLLAGLMIAVGAATGSGFVAALIAFYSLGAYAASRRAVIIMAMVAIGAFVAQPEPSMDRSEPIWILLMVSTLFTVPPVLLGMYMGTRKQLLASLQERTRRLERERTLLAERARVEERARIAREMHDVVANRVSVMVVHAGALKAIVDRDPARAAETAAVIGDMGRQALDELRQVIGVLRLGEEAYPLEVPRQEEIRELVAQSRAAGLRVNLVMECADGTMPPAVARTAYRVIQEALTNVHKHAGHADTEVLLRHVPAAIEMRVRNAPPEPGRLGHALPSGGNGLIGLRERVTALGGAFDAGPAADGGFLVHARIPLPSGGP
jgi:signal transduction histidine kinase